jgi:hypothetical protein
MNTHNVTRLEIIDHTDCEYCGGTGRIYNMNNPQKYLECGACGGAGFAGRSVVFWDKNTQVDLEIQDGGQTLKVFLHPRGDEGGTRTMPRSGN